MLKQAIAMAITIPIVIGNIAIAGEPDSNVTTAKSPSNFSMNLGLKMWMNEWTLPWDGEGQTSEYHSDNSEMVTIPTFRARYKKVSISASYFPKTEYSFNASSNVLLNHSNGSKWTTQDTGDMLRSKETHNTYNTDSLVSNTSQTVEGSSAGTLQLERSEFDINIGYYVLPSLIVTLGYKQIDRNLLQTDLYIDSQGDYAQKTSGWTIGISGGAPLSGKLGMYGNFSYGINMETEWATDSLSTYDTDYYSGEFGLSYGHKFDSMPVVNAIAMYLGYRVQSLIEDYSIHDNGTKRSDYTHGLILGINLVF
ncbi:MAG: hypothetical protein KAH77_11080 [Thiomargarita sp.]|nr:hypothetical protein [Thiomargarita sp.]